MHIRHPWVPVLALATLLAAPNYLLAQSQDDPAVVALVKAAETILARGSLADREVLLSRGVAVPIPSRRPEPGESVYLPGTYRNEHGSGVLDAVVRGLGARLQVHSGPGPLRLIGDVNGDPCLFVVEPELAHADDDLLVSIT